MNRTAAFVFQPLRPRAVAAALASLAAAQTAAADVSAAPVLPFADAAPAKEEVAAPAPPPPASTAGGAPAAMPPSPGAAPASALSPAELAEIEAAASEDAEARRAAGGAAAPAAGGAGQAFASLNPDIAFIFDAAAAHFSADEPLQTGGHDPRKTGFNWQQLEASISGVVDPFFRFDSYLVFSPYGVEVEEAFATTLALPHSLQARVGQFLTRFGRLNPTHPHAWDFVDQPFALGRVFGGEGNRGLGGELSWLAPLPWYVEAVASATEAAGEATARSFYGASDLGVASPLDLQLTLALKQFFPLSDDLGLSWGLSGAAGPNATGHGNRSEIYGTDLYLKYRPLSGGSHTVIALQSEWLYRRRQVPRDVLSDLSGYASATWRFARRWSVGARWELGTRAIGEGGARAADALDPEWTTQRQRVTAAATFFPSEFSRLRLQAARDDAGWRGDADWSVMLAVEFLIGAHGAHKY